MKKSLSEPLSAGVNNGWDKKKVRQGRLGEKTQSCRSEKQTVKIKTTPKIYFIHSIDDKSIL